MLLYLGFFLVKNKMLDLQQHPLSAAFPAMHADEYQSLVDSIGDIGVQNPITIFEGMVLDGWHRYTAANESGMACPTVELLDVDPRDFVLAQNKARRNLSASQRATAVTAVYAWAPAHREKKVALSTTLSKTSSELAAIAGVSAKTIQQAKGVQTHAAPEVVEAVKRGEIGLPKAAAIAKLPIAEQASALRKPLPKPVKPAQVVEPEQPAPPDYTELDAANDLASELRYVIASLNADVALKNMAGTNEEKQQAASLIAELQSENKTLEAALGAVTLSRDYYIEENSQMKRQMAMQRKEIEKLKSNK